MSTSALSPTKTIYIYIYICVYIYIHIFVRMCIYANLAPYVVDLNMSPYVVDLNMLPSSRGIPDDRKHTV